MARLLMTKKQVRRKIRLASLIGIYGCFLLYGVLKLTWPQNDRTQLHGDPIDIHNNDLDFNGLGQSFASRRLLQSANGTGGNVTVATSTEKTTALLQTPALKNVTVISTTTFMSTARSNPVTQKPVRFENVTYCIPPAIEDFPRDFLTPVQRSHGGLIIHIIICAYTLLMIAIACDDYFVESLEGISSGT